MDLEYHEGLVRQLNLEYLEVPLGLGYLEDLGIHQLEKFYINKPK